MDHRERIYSRDDDISLLYGIGLRSSHIYSEISTRDRCGSFFYLQVWTDRIIRVDHLIIAIGRHTERDDKNRSDTYYNREEDIFLHS